MAEPVSPLNVLVVGSAWPPETFIANLLQGLLERGIHITVACSRKPADDWLNQAGFHWLFAPGWEGNPIARLACLVVKFISAKLFSPQELQAIASQVNQSASLIDRLRSWYVFLPFIGHKWDLIYFPWNTAAISYSPLFQLGRPAVISCRGAQINIAPHNSQREGLRKGLASSLQQATAVHCVSKAILQEAVQYGLDPNKANVISPAVNLKSFFPSLEKKPNEQFIVVTTGSLIWRKGHEYALIAIRHLIDAGVDAEFHIIGDGPERPRVLYTIQDLGLKDRVFLHGKLSPTQVRDRLQKADVFLLSSLSEGISNAVLEAMACGLPVVTTDCGGMREAVTDAVEGFVVPVRDPGAMAGALQRLANDSDLRTKMGKAARERVKLQFALKDQINAFVNLFSSIMENK
jgi:glycosyltransferase involved in cell wall biosynthesis